MNLSVMWFPNIVFCFICSGHASRLPAAVSCDALITRDTILSDFQESRVYDEVTQRSTSHQFLQQCMNTHHAFIFEFTRQARMPRTTTTGVRSATGFIRRNFISSWLVAAGRINLENLTPPNRKSHL